MIKLKWEIIWTGGLSHLSGLPHLPWVPHLYVNRPLVGCVVYWLEFQAAVNRPCYCYRWTRGWSWRPCLWYNTLLRYYVNYVVLMLLYFLSIISMRKGKRLLSKQGQPQPYIHLKASILSTIVKWSIPPVKYADVPLASHAGVFRGILFPPTTPLKTPAWEAFL